jgi:tetratricopeptide (TPR) repeat protein
MATLVLVLVFLASVGALHGESSRVAVLDFTPENGSNGNGDWTVGLADFVELALQKEGVVTLERRQIRLVLGERELQSGGMVRAADLRQRGLPAVDYFVSGSLRRLAGNEFALTVSLNRADNATMESSFTRRGVYPTEWLSAIDSLAKEAGGHLRSKVQASPSRSEFESLTWLPEAALPFFKGLEYFARGDYPLAAGWFRTASGKDPRFDQARLWEARALRQFGFPELAEFALAATGKRGAATRTNDVTSLESGHLLSPSLSSIPNGGEGGRRPGVEALGLLRSKRESIVSETSLPIVAVIAPETVPMAGRAAFVNVLARSGRFEMFEPQAIGATAREIDLQLTGQMAAPLNERSVWLVVDSMVFLEMADGKLRARQSDLLSGEPVRQVAIRADGAEEQSFARLATQFLNTPAKEDAKPSLTIAEESVVEPKAGDRSEVVFGKVLRLAKAHPEQARPWIGLADFYGEWTPRMLLLDRAIATIERDPNQPEASFWLTSALWRKRYMLRRAYFYPGAPEYQENPLTNDFALLLKMYPQSTEAQTLDEWTHKAGKYTYSHPKGRDTRYLIGAAYGDRGPRTPPDPSASVGNGKPPVSVSESQWLARLKQHRELGHNAKAWMQANWRVPPLSAGAEAELDCINAELLPIALREAAQFKAFTTATERGEKERALELGRELLDCLFRTQRLAVIEKCGLLMQSTRGCEAQVNFLLAQMERYRDDFNFDPVTGAPRTETVDFRFDNPRQPGSWANTSPDLSYARVLGEVVESGTVCGNLELTAKVCEALRNNEALPVRNRLTAQFDLARTRYDQGRPFEAMELLQELLQRPEIAGTPQARGETWGSMMVEPAAFELLKKIRLFADPEVNFSDCCGEWPQSPLPKPDNLDEMNRWFGELWSRVRGGVGGNNRSLKEELLERRAEALPAILYNLQHRQDAQRMLMFAGFLGTNAVAALPLVTHYVCRSDPHPYVIYGNALAALSGFGRSAGCAMPVLILASEGSEYLFNVKAALAQIGPAPPRVMPYLARLLYHKSPAVVEKAARAMIETAALNRPPFRDQSGEELIHAVRYWWEQDGSKQDWMRP